jgi:hypothetical protein
MTNYTANLIGGPQDKRQYSVLEAEPFLKFQNVAPPAHPTSQEPDSWVKVYNHVYELDALRLVLGDEVSLFYHYIGIADEGEIF